MIKAIKKVIKCILKFVWNICKTLLFIAMYTRNGLFRKRLPLKPKNGKTITLLANAPSLKSVLPRLSTDEEFKHTDFVVLNYFANTLEFFQIKPQHYCLADPMFYRDTVNKEKTQNLFKLLNDKVDWDMNVYIISGLEKQFKYFSRITNNKLHLVSVVCGDYTGFPTLKNWLYIHNFATPVFQSVAIMALYVGINLGYSSIRIYGVDHTVFEGLCVNEKNQACWRDSHFYGDGEAQLRPIIRADDGKVFKMSEFLFAYANTFKSHDLIADYSLYTKTDILNCSPTSLVDSYPRLHKATNYI